MSSPDSRRRRARKPRPLVVPADSLLTFSRYSPPAAQRSSPSQRALPNKAPPVRAGESLVQASHRFALLPHLSTCVLDALLKPIDWQLVELVFVVGKPQCPICLNGVSVPRITPCGHVFDHVCFLQHLSFASDQRACAPCPLCSSSVSASDLRACCFVDANVLQLHVPFRMTLISSHKRALIAVPHHTCAHHVLPTDVSLRKPFFSRFAIADANFLLELVASDMRHLRRILKDDVTLTPFVHASMNELKQKKAEYRARRRANVEQQTASVDNDTCQLWYFYQASDTTNVFLHPVNHRCLNTEFECNFDNAPREIEGEVLQIHRHTMDDQLRKRYRFLSHLPNGCEFSFVELDLSRLLSARTLNIHAHELKEREKSRKRMQMISRKEDRLREKHESQQMKRYVKSQSSETASAYSQPQTVDSTDCTSFPALTEQARCEDESEDGAETRATEDRAPTWGSDVSSYSSVTSNMGLFPALGDAGGVAANAGTNAAQGQGAWGATCSSSSGARSATRETRKSRKGHGKCTIVLSNAGAQHRR